MQITVITTLSHIHPLSIIKGKLKRRDERFKHKITPRHVIEEKTEELGDKPLHDPPSRNDPLMNKLEYKNTKKTL